MAELTGMKSVRASGMRLSTQIAASMLIAVFCVGILAGEAVRYLETNRLHQILQERANLTISLLNGLMMEAIIIEDVPLIETALEEAIVRNPSLVSIAVNNEGGKTIAQYPEVHPEQTADISRFTQDVELEGEMFGSITVDWSRASEELQIERSVQQARIYAGVTIAALSLLFLFLAYRLVLRPLRTVHGRMSATLMGKPGKAQPCPVLRPVNSGLCRDL